MLGSASPRLLLIAESDERKLGFLVANFAVDECELENIVVVASERRKGIARELMRALITTAHEHNATRIFLEVRESNIAARVLYRTCGFTVTGVRKSYYRNPDEDAVLYSFEISQRD